MPGFLSMSLPMPMSPLVLPDSARACAPLHRQPREFWPFDGVSVPMEVRALWPLLGPHIAELRRPVSGTWGPPRFVLDVSCPKAAIFAAAMTVVGVSDNTPKFPAATMASELVEAVSALSTVSWALGPACVSAHKADTESGTGDAVPGVSVSGIKWVFLWAMGELAAWMEGGDPRVSTTLATALLRVLQHESRTPTIHSHAALGALAATLNVHYLDVYRGMVETSAADDTVLSAFSLAVVVTALDILKKWQQWGAVVNDPGCVFLVHVMTVLRAVLNMHLHGVGPEGKKTGTCVDLQAVLVTVVEFMCVPRVPLEFEARCTDVTPGVHSCVVVGHSPCITDAAALVMAAALRLGKVTGVGSKLVYTLHGYKTTWAPKPSEPSTWNMWETFELNRWGMFMYILEVDCVKDAIRDL